MFLGLFFAVFIVSGTLVKFAEPQSRETTGTTLNRRIVAAEHSKNSQLKRWLLFRLRWVRIRDNRVVRTIRQTLRKRFVFVSLAVELFAMVLLVVYRNIDGNTQNSAWPLLVFVFSLQVILYFLLLIY